MPILTVEADKSGAFATAGNATMKQLRQNQETRPAAKAPRRRVPTRSELQEELTEVVRYRAAISEVLRAIANSPHDLQPIFDAILDNATRLCRANLGTLRLYEEEGFRLVSRMIHPSTAFEGWSPPMLVEQSFTFVAQLIASRSPAHIPDLAHDLDIQSDPRLVDLVKSSGIRTFLGVPMLKEEEVIGAINIGRVRVEPFTEKEIELMMDFAAQAAIALEATRRERQLRELQMELAHASRVATLGQLTASIVHEVKQPIAATVVNAQAALRFFGSQPVDLNELRQIFNDIMKDGNRAGEVVDRIRDLVKKAPPRRDTFDINKAIRDVLVVTHGEAVKNGVSVQTQLTEGLPLIQGDRVQLQQVMLNLIINAIQAISGLAEGIRELHIATENTKSEGVRVAVRDSGPGLAPDNLQRLFEPFYTTKPNGMGMGLSICRSIIEAHGGRLWATGHAPQGALFQFTVPST